MLHSYPEFKNDILQIFSRLITEYNLEIKVLREGSYILYNSKCGLRFSYDRGDIMCDIRQKENFEDKPFYPVNSVCEFLFPDKHNNISTDRLYDPKLQIQEFYNIIDNSLQLILNGDFSWINDFDIEQLKKNKLIKYVLGLSYHHPLYKSLNSGHKNWLADAEEYVINNNIQIL